MEKPLLALRSFQILTGLLVGLVVVGISFWWGGSPDTTGPGPDRAESYFLEVPLPAPDFRLRSHRGEEVGPADFQDELLLVFFGYTSCPDVCPLTLNHLAQAIEGMDPEDASRIQVLLITVDPERDSPARLEDYLSNFGQAFLGLTGTEDEIRDVANAFGAFFARSGEGESYTVDHTARTFVVDPSGTIPLTFPLTATPEEIALDLEALLDRGVESPERRP